jgi:hypothetical protein
MEKYIKSLLREGLDKVVSKNYLTDLLANVTNAAAKKLLKQWLSNSVNDEVVLSIKQYDLLRIIKSGGILPKDFNVKN